MNQGLVNSILNFLCAATIFCFFQSHALAQSVLEESISRGQQIYKNECISCHMENGEGIVGAFPPLAQSDYFANDVSKAVEAIINGLEGELTVNGTTYFGVMDPVPLSDQEIADVLNYVRNSWGGKAAILTKKDVSNMKGSKVISK